MQRQNNSTPEEILYTVGFVIVYVSLNMPQYGNLTQFLSTDCFTEGLCFLCQTKQD